MFGVELPPFHTWNLKHRRRMQESFGGPGPGILADPRSGFLVGAPGLFQILKQSVACAGCRQMGGFKNSSGGRNKSSNNAVDAVFANDGLINYNIVYT
jgi:hypothetical protein